MADPILATGTLLKISNGADPAVFAAIAQLRSVTPPQISRNAIETNVHNTVGGWETSIMGMLRSGEVSADVNWLPDDPTHDHTDGLLSKLLSNVKGTWQVAFPGGAIAQFDGWVQAFNPQAAETDNVLTAQITIKPTGAVTFTA